MAVRNMLNTLVCCQTGLLTNRLLMVLMGFISHSLAIHRLTAVMMHATETALYKKSLDF